MKRKDESIETLRGIAIILMVAGHVVGHNEMAGMRVDDDSTFRYFYYTLQYIRMPLFTVISGYVYSMRPFTTDTSLGKFINGKARRLIIPMISVSTLQYLMRVFVPGINNSTDIESIWKIYLFGFDQFWFLQSIFLIFVTIALIEYFKLLSKFILWLIFLFLSAGFCIFIPEFSFNIFSVNGYLQLLPFFILGCGINRYGLQLFKRRFVILYVLVFICSFSIQQIQWFIPFIHSDLTLKVLAFSVAVSAIALIFNYRFRQPFLAKIGYYAFAIYLFHVFGTAGSRSRLELILPEASPVFVFFISLTFGIGIPIAIEYLLKKNDFMKTAFIGVASRKKKRKDSLTMTRQTIS